MCWPAQSQCRGEHAKICVMSLSPAPSITSATDLSIGVTFPIHDLRDPGAIRAFAQGIEELGYDHLITGDHVAVGDRARYEAEQPYHQQRFISQSTPVHEVLTLCAYIAGFSGLGLMPSVLILPQRQTVLVAKQAAELDILTGGKFRLGVGIGWNPYEYEALGQDFSTRGARSAEQVRLLRSLFTEESVTFEGAHESITGIGINPLPVQRPIPIWLGASGPAGWRRAGRLGDGWIPGPVTQPGQGLEEAKLIVDKAAEKAGRDPGSIGIEGYLRVDEEDDLAPAAARWLAAGATHLAVRAWSPQAPGERHDVDDHLEPLRAAAKVLFRTREAASPTHQSSH
jgi:probable F420-dependent oxidoreductase